MEIKGKGSLEQRSEDVWRFRFNTGFDQNEKKYRYTPWRTVRGTEDDARSAMKEYMEELKGLSFEASTCRFALYAEHYLEGLADSGKAPSTIQHESYQVKYLIGYLGNTLLIDIGLTEIEKILKTHRKTHSLDAVKRLRAVLNRILNSAVKRRLIKENPVKFTDPPKVEQEEMKPLDKAGIAKLNAALAEYSGNKPESTQKPAKPGASLSGKVMEANVRSSRTVATRIALATGMRRGEVLGLTWDHIDFEKGQISIHQAMTDKGMRPPKTVSGKRKVRVSASTLEVLKAWKAEQAEYLYLLKYGHSQQSKIVTLDKVQTGETPVINNQNGGFLYPNALTKWWRAFCEDNAINIRFHDLRHTFATQLLAGGIDVVTVSHMLGHSKTSITLDIYAHYISGMDERAAALMGEIIDTTPTAQVVNFG